MRFRMQRTQTDKLMVSPDGPRRPVLLAKIIQQGDTLLGLAEKYYGDKEKAELIFDANRAVLANAEDLPPGTRLIIPSAASQQPAATGDRLDPWK